MNTTFENTMQWYETHKKLLQNTLSVGITPGGALLLLSGNILFCAMPNGEFKEIAVVDSKTELDKLRKRASVFKKSIMNLAKEMAKEMNKNDGK